MKMQVAVDGQTRLFCEAGKALFYARQGQLNPPAHDFLTIWLGNAWAAALSRRTRNGYPEYRLEWPAMGSLERRIRNCLLAVCAELFWDNALDLVELELYLDAAPASFSAKKPQSRRGAVRPTTVPASGTIIRCAPIAAWRWARSRRCSSAIVAANASSHGAMEDWPTLDESDARAAIPWPRAEHWWPWRAN